MKISSSLGAAELASGWIGGSSFAVWGLAYNGGSLSKVWWEQTLDVAEDFYWRWLESTPLERLRLKPTAEVDPVHMRLEAAWNFNVAGDPS